MSSSPSNKNVHNDPSSSPVQTKLTALTSKSSFASFFCKKRPILNLNSDELSEVKSTGSDKDGDKLFEETAEKQVKNHVEIDSKPIEKSQNTNNFITIIDDDEEEEKKEEEGKEVESFVYKNQKRSSLRSKKNQESKLVSISISSSDSDTEIYNDETKISSVSKISTVSCESKVSSESNELSSLSKESSSEFKDSSNLVKSSANRQYLPAAFDSLDPSLREEMISRLNQSKSTFEKPSTLETEKEFALFAITQRLNRGTFDKKFAINGQLMASPTFNMVWRMTDSFGAMKNKIAEHLRVSPFELVLARFEDETELFDTTKPISLNFEGVTSQEYSNFFSNPKIASFFGRPKEALPIHRLFLYTKTSFQQYKSMHEDEKRLLFESIAYLKTAAPQPETTSEIDSPDEADENVSKINLNVKTAASKNQSYSISLASSQKLDQILKILESQHKITAKKIIFDGDVLNLNSTIGDIFEDEDMIEIQ